MTNTKHTPGPWKQTDDTIVCAKRNGMMQRVADTRFSDSLKKEAAENKANARLIAAAPELLAEAMELLRNARYADGEATVLTQDCEALEAALAKARGEA